MAKIVKNTLNEKTALITGGTSGIGLATAISLAELGARVYITSRESLKGTLAVQKIKEESGSNEVRMLLADLSSLNDVRSMVSSFHKQEKSGPDILINNAAIAPSTRQTSVDGFELQFAVNHLSHFLLTELLLESMLKKNHARIVNISSALHKKGKINFSDLQFINRPYRIIEAYANSKLMNILYTRELAERLNGSNIVVSAVHPGVISTNIYRALPSIVSATIRLFMKSPSLGAETPVHVSVSPEAASINGGYWVNKQVVDPIPAAHDMNTARELTKISRQLSGLQ